MTYEEAYIKVCDGYKKDKPIKELIEKHLYTLNPEEEYPRLNFDMWLRWACRESHDDSSNPVLILCMAEYMKEERRWSHGVSNTLYHKSLNDCASAALAVSGTINWFSLDDNNYPSNIINSAVRYLFNEEDINDVISDAGHPIDESMITQLPDCGVEYFSRSDLKRFFKNEREYLKICGINPDIPF